MTAVAAEEHPRVGPYRVLQAIGAGGSARIDLARIDRAYGFQRHVVLKRPLEHLRGDASVAASLQREARIGGQLRHPNLVAILDAGVHDGYDYLVLEYVHGAALRAVMHADQPGEVRALPLAVALAIVASAARGLHEAHELADATGAPLGLVHRDVSPGNILLGLDGTVKLADFGIAKETRVSTLSGSIRGTVTYMAPEQCRGHAYDRRADVFSLGVILYELVTATRLFWADNDVASLHRVLSGIVPRPRTRKPALAAALEDIVMTAVAHDAVQRHPTALALATEIERYAADAGEVLGARWIARTVAEVVGAKQVPWIAAPTQVEAAPSDGSLVALIAAEHDEATDPTFDETDEPAAPIEVPDARGPSTLTEPAQRDPRAPSTPTAPVALPASAVPTAPRHRSHRIAAGLVALVVVAAAALVVTRSSSGTRTSTPTAASAAHASSSAARAAQPTAVTAPPTAATAQPTPVTAPPTPVTAQPTAVTAPPTAVTAQPTAVTAPPTAVTAPPTAVTAPPAASRPAADPSVTTPPTVTPSRRPLRLTPASTAAKHKRRPPASRRVDRASTPPAEAPARLAAPPADPGSPPPAARPAAKVEWKPTLLLPTDGSGARPKP